MGNLMYGTGPDNMPVEIQCDTKGNVLTSIVGSLTNVIGSKNVTTAGTRVQLSANQPCREVLIKAKRGNTGYIYLGDVTVSSVLFGVDLGANESMVIQIANLNQLYLDSSVNGEGVTFFAI